MKLSNLLRRDPAIPTLRERATALREGLSRRETVLGVAAVAVAAPPAAASAPNPDAHLIALWQKREEANRDWLAASASLDESTNARHSMEWPEALAVQFGDGDLGLARLANYEHEGRTWYWIGEPGADQFLTPASRLRQPRLLTVSRPVCPADNLPADAQRIAKSIPWPEAQTRADEIVIAWDARQDEIARRNAASGYDAAEALEEACQAALLEVEQEIIGAEAHTLAGITIKARVALIELERGFDPDERLLRTIADALIALNPTTA